MIVDFHAHVGMGTPRSTDPEQRNIPAEVIATGAVADSTRQGILGGNALRLAADGFRPVR